MSFDTNRRATLQEHFIIVEIDLPQVVGVCTSPDGGEGFYTPPTCNEEWDETTFKTYRFGTSNTPLDFGRPQATAGTINEPGPLYRVIRTVTEDPTIIKPGQGLAATATLTVVFNDFEGDPGPERETLDGTFFGKLAARNILTNKEIRIRDFHVISGDYTDADARTRRYIIDKISSNGKGQWTIKARDSLSRLDFDQSQFPEPTGGFLRGGISDSTTTIPVDAETDYSVCTNPRFNVVKIGSELMLVTAVNNNLTSSATLRVASRNGEVVQPGKTHFTDVESHDAGDAVQICYVSDEMPIETLLFYVMFTAGIPVEQLDSLQWADELSEWHPNTRINYIWHEPEASDQVIELICMNYLIDVWFDQTFDAVRLSAISVWRESNITINDGQEISYNTLKATPDEANQFTRAFIYFDKPFPVRNDDLENYKGLSFNINDRQELPGFYGEPKVMQFDNSPILDRDAADLLTQRYVARFSDIPIEYEWTTEEKYLNFGLGEVADINSPDNQGPDGRAASVRGQIISIKPKWDDTGRIYTCKALTYSPALVADQVFVFSGEFQNFNIHTALGAPPQAVNVTVVFDAADIWSNDTESPALRAGAFAPGSSLVIILTNGSQFQSAGGAGGHGGEGFKTGEAQDQLVETDPEPGQDGGLVYAAGGTNTDLYLSGATGVPAHPTANGALLAPGGGGGGGRISENTFSVNGGGGGGGGAGRIQGPAGQGGSGDAASGSSGTPGTTEGAGGLGGSAPGQDGEDGGAWGQPGQATSSAAGGAAGRGLEKNGAQVRVFGGTAGNFINGAGDAPD